MTKRRDIPGPSQKKAPEKNPSEKLPCPTPSPFLCKDYCFTRTLTPYDVMPTNPELYIDAWQGISLFDSPETKFFLVYDEDKSKSYNMLFSHYVTWEFVRYSISADWETFVTDHNLKAGDEISFYRYADKNVCNGYFYILKFVKKPSGGKDDDEAESSEKASDDVTEDKRKKKNMLGPGSRPMTVETHCFVKTLTAHEVVQENPKLYFGPENAVVLTGSPDILQHVPGTYSKDLFVFDKDDRQYTMKLSHRASVGPETSYVLNTGWGTFVRTQGLKEGDWIMFYRLYDDSVYAEDHYYVLRSEPHVAVMTPPPESDVAPDDRVAEVERKLEYLKERREKLAALLELCSLLEKADVAAETGQDDEEDDDAISGGAN